MALTQRWETRPKPLAWLPMRLGFKFYAVLADGSQVLCTVQIRGGELETDPVALDDIHGWKDAPQ